MRVFGVTTTTAGRPFDASDMAFARGLAVELKLDAFGWAEPTTARATAA